MSLVFALAAALLAAPTPTTPPVPSVQSVLARPLERIKSADLRATGRLVQVDGGGKRLNRSLTIKAHWFPGVLRILCEISAPAEARARILLELRPGGENTIRIARPGDKSATVLPFDRWSEGPLGAAFSYEDLLEEQFFWPGQTVLEITKYGTRDCDLLRSIPGPADRTHYAEVKTWLDRGIGYPVYVVKTLKSSGTVKEFTYLGLRQNGGVWSAGQMEVKVRGQAGSTLLIIERGSTKARLDLRDFDPEHLNQF